MRLTPACSALTCFEARIGLIDDVDTSTATDQTIGTVTGLQRFDRVLDFHGTGPDCGRLNLTDVLTNKGAPSRFHGRAGFATGDKRTVIWRQAVADSSWNYRRIDGMASRIPTTSLIAIEQW